MGLYPNYQGILSWRATWLVLGSRTGSNVGNELERLRLEAQGPFEGFLQYSRQAVNKTVAMKMERREPISNVSVSVGLLGESENSNL